MKRHKLYIFFLVMLLISSLYSKDAFAFENIPQNSLLCVAAGLGVVSTVWACAEHYRCTKRDKKISCLCTQNDELKQKVAAYQQGIIQKENDQQFLSDVAHMRMQFVQKYNPLNTIMENKNVQNNELLDAVNTFLHDTSLTVDEYAKELTRDIDILTSTICKLEMKYVEPLSLSCKERIHEELLLLERLQKTLQSCVHWFLQYKLIVKISHYLGYDIEPYYTPVAEILASYSTQEDRLREIDKYIRGMYAQSNVYFPYITYAEHIARILMDLKELLPLCSGEYSWGNEIIEQAQMTIDILQTVLHLVVTSSYYIHEKDQKPEFDRQEQRLQAELQERKERVEQERWLVELKLTKERVKEQELIKECQMMEQKNRELEAEKYAMMLKLERIKEQENIKKCEAQWREYCAQQDAHYQVQIVQLSERIKECDAIIHELHQQLNALREKHALDERQREGYIHQIKNSLEECIQTFSHSIEKQELSVQEELDHILAQLINIQEQIAL